MNLTKLSVKRPVTLVMILLILIMFGIISLLGIPLEQMPEIDIPYASVIVVYPGATPQEIESIITIPLEDTLKTVPNVKSIRSTSADSRSVITIEFAENTDIDINMNKVKDKVENEKKRFPNDVNEPMYIQRDMNDKPSMKIGVSGDCQISELNRITEEIIIPQLERTKGVANVDKNGGIEEEVQVVLKPNEMESYGLTIFDITNTLSSKNSTTPIGEINKGDSVISLKTSGKFESLDDIRNTKISTKAGSTVLLKEIAIVDFSLKEIESYVYFDNKTGIILEISKQSLANNAEVCSDIEEQITKLTGKYPEIDFTILSNQGESISDSISTVANSAILGCIIAGLVVLVFMGTIMDTLAIVVAIPVAILFTFGFMYAIGVTINMVSLGGLTLGVGMLVDNSIVVLENIYRKYDLTKDPVESALDGTKEILSAILASTLTTIAVFAPMLMVVSGIVGAITFDLAISVIFSLISSLLVSVTIVPMIASKTLGKEKKQGKILGSIVKGWGKLINLVQKQYSKVLCKALRYRFKTIIIAISLILFSGFLALGSGFELYPSSDEGEFSVKLEYPYDYDLGKMISSVDEIESTIKTIPEVDNTTKEININGEAKISVEVIEDSPRPTSEIVEECRILLSETAGVKISLSESSGVGSLSGSEGTSVQIYGLDIEDLKEISIDIEKILLKTHGVTQVENSFNSGTPQGEIKIDANKAAEYGLNMETVTGILYTTVNGSGATTYTQKGNDYDVTVKYDDEYIDGIEKLMNISIPTNKGMIPLYEIATIETRSGMSQIERIDGRRYATLSVTIPGLDAGSSENLIREALSDYTFKSGYSYDFGESSSMMIESLISLVYSLLLGALIVYMVMAAQFESFIEPFIIIITIPLAIIGVFLGLYITNTTINMISLLGIVILVGIVVNNAIVLVDYINLLRAEGMDKREAILTAGKTRLRPILMTTLTTVLAMIPMAYGAGEMSSMAISVVFGLSCSTVLTLVVIPVVYDLFDGLKIKEDRVKNIEI